MTKVRMMAVLVGAIALILVVLALQLLAPGDTLRQSGPDSAQIVFSADHNMLIAPGACGMVRWQVDQIQTVYINGTPTVGQGFKDICVDESTQPVLHIVFKDHSAADYTLQIKFLIDQPTTWLLITAAVLLALVGLYTAISRPSAPAQASAGGKRTPRIVLVFAGIGMVCTALLIGAGVLELGLRLYFGHFGTLSEQNAYLDTRAEIEAVRASTISLPFIEYGLSPDYPGHNSLGYRGDPVQVPKPTGTFRIVALGDSATYGTTNPYDQTYPYYLQQTLQQEGYKNVEVVNGGVFGFTSWNTLADLAFRTVELQPDLVIINQGGNDATVREVSPDCYSKPSPFLGLDPRRQLRAEPDELSASALYRLIAINLGWLHNPADFQGAFFQSRLTCDTTTNTDPAANLAANAPIYFEHNVRGIIGIAQANHFPLLLTTYAYNPNSSSATPYWRTGVAQENVITKQLAQENKTLFFDWAATAPTDANSWNDSIHMTRQGNLAEAQTLAKFLVDQAVITGKPTP